MWGVWCVPAGEYDRDEFTVEAYVVGEVLNGFYWVVDVLEVLGTVAHFDASRDGGHSHLLAAFVKCIDAIEWADGQQ